MTERDKFEANEKKVKIYLNRGGLCEICREPVTLAESQLAHRISKGQVKKYGKEVIHHEKNIALTCGNRFGRCNDACNIGNRPEEVRLLVEEIRGELDE